MKDIWQQLKKRHADRRLYFLDGIRVWGAIAVHFGHAMVITVGLLPTDQAPVPSSGVDVASILSAGGLLVVDTFFFTSGFLLTFLGLRTMAAAATLRCRLLLGLRMIWKRWFRLVGLVSLYVMYSVLAQWLLTFEWSHDPQSTRGRVLEIAKESVYGGCRKHWLQALTLTSNIAEDGRAADCIAWAWYIDNDWQFFLFGMLLCVLFARKRVAFATCTSIAIILSVLQSIRRSYEVDYSSLVVSDFRVPAVHGLLLADIFVVERGNFFRHLYIRPECRAAPYLVGLLFGAWMSWQDSDRQRAELPVGLPPPSANEPDCSIKKRRAKSTVGSRKTQLRSKCLEESIGEVLAANPVVACVELRSEKGKINFLKNSIVYKQLEIFTLGLGAFILYSPLLFVHLHMDLTDAIIQGVSKLAWGLTLCLVFYKAVRRQHRWWYWRFLSHPVHVPLSRISHAWYHAHLTALGGIALAILPILHRLSCSVPLLIFMFLVSVPFTFISAILTHIYVEKPVSRFGDVLLAFFLHRAPRTKNS